MHSTAAAATFTIRRVYCPPDTNSTATTTFKSALSILHPSLSTAAAANNGFSNQTSSGDPPNKVYALALCRGDVSAGECLDCLYAAKLTIEKHCPLGTTAAVWNDKCMIRYSNQSFFSTYDAQSLLPSSNPGIVPNTTLFNQLLGDLLDKLTNRAAYGADDRVFAVGETNYTEFNKLYGMAQCSRDLSENTCYDCLRYSIRVIPSCCDGKAGAWLSILGCDVRYESSPFYNLSFEASPPPSVAPGKSSNKTKVVVIGIISAVASILVLLSTIFIFLRRRKPIKKIPYVVEEDFRRAESLLFDLGILRAATNSFSDANKLGEGGFGPVYMGTLPNGQEIAVKRLSRGSGQGLVELRNEVVLVAKLQHRNLVRLLGCCLDDQEKLLVYEYLPNTSLDKFLFDPVRRQQLDWSRRYKIIEGISRGLLYLHEDSRLRIIHRDMKASNILLDRDMNPKISDFGLAKLFGIDETQGNTNHVAGTFGYMAPEYVMHGHFSTKSDVFSYGVLVLEIVTGRKNSSFRESGRAIDLLGYVWRHWNEGIALQVKDESLGDRCQIPEVLRCIQIGLLCVQEDPNERPSMQSVVLMLSSYSFTLSIPSAPAFIIRGSTTSELNVLARESNIDMLESDKSEGVTKPLRTISANVVTISEMEPR